MTTNEVENSVEKRRSLDELLKLESYQGMTDEEIGRVLDWRESKARTEALQAAELEAIKTRGQEMAEKAEAEAQRMRELMDQVIASIPKPKRVDGMGEVVDDGQEG